MCSALLKASLAIKIWLIIEKETDPVVIWETLKNNFEVTGLVKKSFVSTEFYNVKIYPDEDLSLFIARHEAAYWKVVEGEETISETHWIHRLTKNLSNEYDFLVREIENTNAEDFTFEKVKTLILTEFN